MRPAWLALAAGLIAVFAWALAAPQAQAAFSTGKCAGPDITGQGASFARDAHQVFNFNFATPFCNGTPGAGTIDVAYIASGSGSGRTAVTRRDLVPRFGMTDDPLTPAQTNTINTGSAATGDEGVINVVPAAVGAVAPLVNFPNGCSVNQLNPESRTVEQDRSGDGIPDGVVRVSFTKAEWEGIWSQDPNFAQWDDVFPELAVPVPPATAPDPDCDKDIIRVVRFDESGTTFAFKDYLNTIDGGEGWLTTYKDEPTLDSATPPQKIGNRLWPLPGGAQGDLAAFGTPSAQCGSGGPGAPGPQADNVDRLTSGCAAGNEFLVEKLKSTDGSVGYSDISTASVAGLRITPRTSSSSGFDNDTYIAQIPSGPGAGVPIDATRGQFGFRADGAQGSNCDSATFRNVPPTTKGNWENVSGVNSAGAYGICTITYGLVFDDNSTVWTNTPAEEAKARTVKDYWESALTDQTQSQLVTKDYSPLTESLQAIAQAGIAEVGWNKAGDAAAPPPGGGGTPPPSGGGTPPPGPTPISNNITIERTTINSKKGSVTVQVRLPGPGTVAMVGTAKKPKTVGRATLTANAAGSFPITLNPSNRAKKVLKKKGKLRVDLALTYTPTGGTAAERSTGATLRIKKKKKN